MLFSVKVYVTVNCAISHRDVYVGLLSVYLDETFESSDAWPVQHQTYGYLPGQRALLPCDWYQFILVAQRVLVCEQLTQHHYSGMFWS